MDLFAFIQLRPIPRTFGIVPLFLRGKLTTKGEIASRSSQRQQKDEIPDIFWLMMLICWNKEACLQSAEGDRFLHTFRTVGVGNGKEKENAKANIISSFP